MIRTDCQSLSPLVDGSADPHFTSLHFSPVAFLFIGVRPEAEVDLPASLNVAACCADVGLLLESLLKSKK